MKYIACCSFGKDSLAQIIVGKQHNEPIDLVVYSEVMFTQEISGEYPEHRDFIYNVAIPKLKELYGLETVVLRSDKTMWDDFYTTRVRGDNAGKLRGFPIPGLCNINRDCKVPPMKKYLELLGDDVVQYIGIASDEEKRLARLDGVKQISLLAKYGITEKMATDICREAGLLSPIYDFAKRNGCFFCPNSSDKEIRHLYDNHPYLWSTLRTMQGEENTSRERFTRSKTIFDYEVQFQKENSEVNKQNTSMSKTTEKKPFLFPHQEDAISNMKNGCILCGGVGSGKSRTSLAYYFKECGGGWDNNTYQAMTNPRDLYIITTARKRDTKEWEGEMVPFLLTTNPEVAYYKDLKVTVDSWNNIKKYSNVYGAFFIFDEQRVVGSGAWVKAFYKIANKNRWILLSATPGDTWSDYIPVFVANGFYRNKTEFINEHVIYSRFTKYPKIDRYVNTGRLIRYRNQILVDMDFKRKTVSHHEDIYVKYDIPTYKDLIRTRWNPYKNEPIQNASMLCYLLRKVVNSDDSRQMAVLELFEKHPRMIIFYNFDYELDILKKVFGDAGVDVAEWNGHAHQPVPDSPSWVYLVQYTAGAEGWNCIKTDTIVFYSQNYSYKVMLQAAGRTDRMNTPYTDLYYYHLKTRSGIDLAISRALTDKKKFNESKFVKW